MPPKLSIWFRKARTMYNALSPQCTFTVNEEMIQKAWIKIQHREELYARGVLRPVTDVCCLMSKLCMISDPTILPMKTYISPNLYKQHEVAQYINTKACSPGLDFRELQMGTPGQLSCGETSIDTLPSDYLQPWHHRTKSALHHRTLDFETVPWASQCHIWRNGH